jgi:hypothetical protein
LRDASEIDRIEFKAFNAQPSLEMLGTLCHLLIGICLAKLPGRDETPNLPLYCLHATRTPAHWLLARWREKGAMVFPGGLGCDQTHPELIQMKQTGLCF